jgi:HEAT repeat protein
MPLIRNTQGSAAPTASADPEAAKVDLRSPDADIRWRGARALAAVPQAAVMLGEAALVETDPRVREAMFTSLGRIATAESVAALVPHVRSDDAERRTAAMDALKAMPQAIGAALPGLLADADPDVRLLACDLVRELPAAEATALLTGVLDRESEINVCAAAVDVLADIGAPEALPALHQCAGRLADPFLAFAIKIACDRIGEQAPPRG